jgi:CBS domain containing-hemolysin-like protein
MKELVLSVGLAIGVSAMCSLFEAVLYSVPFSYLEALAAKGQRAAAIFHRLRENVEQPITAILTLNTVANTFGAAVAGAAATMVFGKAWLGAFSAAFTMAILIFSEILPKTIGVKYAPALAIYVAWPLFVLQKMLWPITTAMGILTRAVGARGPSTPISAEEIRVMARMGRKMGAIRGMEEAVITNILSLSKIKARDLMTPRTVVFCLPKDLNLKEAMNASEVWPWAHSRVPVYDGDVDNIVGIVQRRDVLAALAESRDHLRLCDLMRPAHKVPETVSADRLLADFIERREHLFVVVDEHGGVAGVVSLEDVFEQILGVEIVDETDVTEDLQALAQKRGRRGFRGPEKK